MKKLFPSLFSLKKNKIINENATKANKTVNKRYTFLRKNKILPLKLRHLFSLHPENDEM